MTLAQPSAADFSGFGLSSRILKVLQKLNILVPTPIQHQSIPVVLEGKDVLGIAQTGTGKTFAFGLPVIQRLDSHPGKALIVLPTRELAQQVNDALTPFCRAFEINTAVLIGGISMQHQIRQLSSRPRVIVATPGRLVDFMEQRKVRLDDVSVLVLDEADRMFDMGFAPQLNIIFKAIPKQRQTLLFSATMPPAVLKLTTAHMALPVRVEVAPAGTSSTNVEQEIFIVNQGTKHSFLERVLQDHQGTVLVFSRTKHGAKNITRGLKIMGHKVAEIHSNRSQSQRNEALHGFKTGKYRVLVATDIASRGIDVKGIEVVVNFDLPDNPEDYVHRIGRTGRAGVPGKAISFVMPDQRDKIRTIERLIRKTLVVSKSPELPPSRRPQPSPAAAPSGERRPSSFNRHSDNRKPQGRPQKSSGFKPRRFP